MRAKRRSLIRLLGPALLLLLGSLVIPASDAFAADYGVAHTDGYLRLSGGCMMLHQHDGVTFSLLGNTAGLLNGDHVRLEGRIVRDPGCGAPGFEVSLVQTLWADDNHQSVYFDHLNGEVFFRFAQRSGRLGGFTQGQGRENYGGFGGRYDRDGRYLYEGRHRPVTLIGRIVENGSGCPVLRTRYNTFSLDGDLGEYQDGDAVRVSGTLFDRDPNGPCGGPTLVVHSIRGH